jgi:hypothetical protein
VPGSDHPWLARPRAQRADLDSAARPRAVAPARPRSKPTVCRSLACAGRAGRARDSRGSPSTWPSASQIAISLRRPVRRTMKQRLQHGHTPCGVTCGRIGGNGRGRDRHDGEQYRCSFVLDRNVQPQCVQARVGCGGRCRCAAARAAARRHAGLCAASSICLTLPERGLGHLDSGLVALTGGDLRGVHLATAFTRALIRAKPWEAEGISRRTWERRRKAGARTGVASLLFSTARPRPQAGTSERRGSLLLSITSRTREGRRLLPRVMAGHAAASP